MRSQATVSAFGCRAYGVCVSGEGVRLCGIRLYETDSNARPSEHGAEY